MPVYLTPTQLNNPTIQTYIRHLGTEVGIVRNFFMQRALYQVIRDRPLADTILAIEADYRERMQEFIIHGVISRSHADMVLANTRQTVIDNNRYDLPVFETPTNVVTPPADASIVYDDNLGLHYVVPNPEGGWSEVPAPEPFSPEEVAYYGDSLSDLVDEVVKEVSNEVFNVDTGKYREIPPV